MNKSISLTDLSSALPDLVASVAPSVVAVRSDRSRSSGFVWRAGLIVTADESLSEEGAFSVTLHGGSTVAAHLVGRDPTTDKHALLRVDTDLPPSPIRKSPLAVGALVLAVGAEVWNIHCCPWGGVSRQGTLAIVAWGRDRFPDRA
jgi:S1-C subfamily serine protease